MLMTRARNTFHDFMVSTMMGPFRGPRAPFLVTFFGNTPNEHPSWAWPFWFVEKPSRMASKTAVKPTRLEGDRPPRSLDNFQCRDGILRYFHSRCGDVMLSACCRARPLVRDRAGGKRSRIGSQFFANTADRLNSTAQPAAILA